MTSQKTIEPPAQPVEDVSVSYGSILRSVLDAETFEALVRSTVATAVTARNANDLRPLVSLLEKFLPPETDAGTRREERLLSLEQFFRETITNPIFFSHTKAVADLDKLERDVLAGLLPRLSRIVSEPRAYRDVLGLLDTVVPRGADDCTPVLRALGIDAREWSRRRGDRVPAPVVVADADGEPEQVDADESELIEDALDEARREFPEPVSAPPTSGMTGPYLDPAPRWPGGDEHA